MDLHSPNFDQIGAKFPFPHERIVYHFAPFGETAPRPLISQIQPVRWLLIRDPQSLGQRILPSSYNFLMEKMGAHGKSWARHFG